MMQPSNWFRPSWANDEFVIRKLTVDNFELLEHGGLMIIVSVRHKALRAYLASGRAVGLDARVASRLRNMVAFLVAADSVDELAVPPNFGFHLLTGNRKGTAAMIVTRNWRLTFGLDENNGIVDLDLEDYH